MISPVQFHGEVKQFTRILAVLNQLDGAGNPIPAGERVVTAAEIAAALAKGAETCHCTELGLRPGLTRTQLSQLKGCKDPNYACPTLVRLRRTLAA